MPPIDVRRIEESSGISPPDRELRITASSRSRAKATWRFLDGTLTINLKEMKGQSLPTLLANLVHDLSKELVLEDLEKQLPYSLDELRDSLDLLKIPDGLDDFLKQEAERQARERPQILTFVVEDADVVEAAIETVKRRQGIGTRGKALTAIARAYLEGSRE